MGGPEIVETAADKLERGVHVGLPLKTTGIVIRGPGDSRSARGGRDGLCAGFYAIAKPQALETLGSANVVPLGKARRHIYGPP
jgi:hypothetical protein